jgi:type I restriction enzyme S subunit
VKAGWETMPLQALCNDFKQDIVDGPFGSDLQRKDYLDDGIPVLKIQNIKPFVIELKKMDYVSPAKFQELKRHSFRRGDIVLTKLGCPLGVSAIVEDVEEGVIVADLVRIRAQKVNTRYLCYHLNSQNTSDFINAMQKGTTRPRVTLSVVRDLPIALPSPAEQQRIVRVLDETFVGISAAKANAEKNLQNARALFESHLESVFSSGRDGWVKKRLGDVVTRLTNGYVGPTRNIYHESGVPYLLARHVKNNRLIFDGKTFISDAFNRKHRKSMLKGGDVLLVQSGHIGHSAVVTEGHEGHNCHAMIVITPVNGVITGPFLSLFFNSPGMRQKFEEIRSGSTVPHLTCGAVKELLVALPDVATQQCVLARSQELDVEIKRLESTYQQKVVALDELKKSLLHQAFTGGL